MKIDFIDATKYFLLFYLQQIDSCHRNIDMALCYKQVLETARQVASFPVSSTPIPYDQMKSQCEALVTGKQQKMSVLQSFKQQDTKAIVVYGENVCSRPSTKSVSRFCIDKKKYSISLWFLSFKCFSKSKDLRGY